MLLYNVRLAWKSVLRHPVLSGLIVAGIALGVGVATTFVTAYGALSSDPIPGKSGDLFYVRLDSWDPAAPFSSSRPGPPQQITYRDLRGILKTGIPLRQTGMFKSRMYVYPNASNTVGDRPFQQQVRLAFSDFFPMFDVPFRYGSGWDKTADERAEQVVVLSAALNDRLFGGADSVGKTVRVANRDFRVVGVLAPWRPKVLFYDLTQNPNAQPEDLFMPFNLVEPMEVRSNGNIQSWSGPDSDDFVERLHNTEAVWLQMWVELPTEAQRQGYKSFLDAYALEQKKAGRFQRPLDNRITPVLELMEEWEAVPAQAKSLAAISLLFLVVAALNLIGLFLGKFLARAPIVGVRRALGASRRAIFLQHLVECELVGLIGGAFGLLLSFGGLALLNRVYRVISGTEGFFQLDATMVMTAILLSLAAGALAGIYPAWRICSIPPARHLKNQ